MRSPNFKIADSKNSKQFLLNFYNSMCGAAKYKDLIKMTTAVNDVWQSYSNLLDKKIKKKPAKRTN